MHLEDINVRNKQKDKKAMLKRDKKSLNLSGINLEDTAFFIVKITAKIVAKHFFFIDISKKIKNTNKLTIRITATIQ